MLSLIKKNWLLGLLFITMNGADSATTIYLLKHGHHEGMPVMKAAMVFGFRDFVLCKMLLSALVTLWLLTMKDRERAKRIFVGANIGFGAIILYQMVACLGWAWIL